MKEEIIDNIQNKLCFSRAEAPFDHLKQELAELKYRQLKIREEFHKIPKIIFKISNTQAPQAIPHPILIPSKRSSPLFHPLFSTQSIIISNVKNSMNKNTLTLLIVCALLGLTSSLTVGSCQKYSLDGQSCEQCVDHYHLYQGNCYVNILGCKQYIFGNICHQCENNYIMVNNLCCDHNCLAKLFRRQESSTSVSEAISTNFETLSKMIPYINQKYLKGEKVYNLIQIETRDYLDVRRFVFLYELYSQNRVYRWRAIIDMAKKEEKQMIDVDWSQVPAYENYLDFHHEEIPVTNTPSELKVLLESNQNLRILKKAEFTYLTQYEYVTENPKIANTITYETAYVWPQKNTKITLELRSQTISITPPQFVPKSKVLSTSEEISTGLQKNSNLQAVIAYLEQQIQETISSLITQIQYSTPSEQLIEYSITVNKPQETIKYYLVQNTQNKKIKLVDQKVTKVAEQIETPIQTQEEKVIEEIIEEAIEVVEEEKELIEKEDQCDGQLCGQSQDWMGPLQNQYLGSEIDRIFRNYNPEESSFVIVKLWKRQFETYSEYAMLIQSKDKSKSWYFYVIEYVATQQVAFWGQKQVSEPMMQQNEQGEIVYAHPNPQEIVPEQQVQRGLQEIISSYPQNKGLQTRQAILREFPESRFRYTISIRHETSVVRYVVLEESPSKIWVQEVKVLEENLPKLTEEVKQETELKQKVEVIVEEIEKGEPISPEVDLETSEPTQIVVQIVEEETKEKPLSKKEQSEIKSIQALRQVNPEIQNFQIMYIWQSQDCDHYTEQTILIKIQSIEELYEYHHLLINEDNGEYIYLGKTAQQNILKDQKEHYLLPNPQSQQEKASEELTSALKVAKNTSDLQVLHIRNRNFPEAIRYTLITLSENTSSQIIGLFKKTGEFQIICEEVIKSQIVNKEEYLAEEKDKKVSQIIVKEVVNEIEEIQVAQYVSDQPPKEVAAFVQNTVQQVKDAEPVRTWIHEVSGKVKEVVILYRIKKTYFYIYLMVTDEQQYEYMGKQVTHEPYKNDQNEYMIPNPQVKIALEEPKVQTIIEYLNEEYPETVGKPIQNIIVREFEDVERETVIVEENGSDVEYIIKESDEKLEIKDRVVEESTPLTQEEQTIEIIVKEAIEIVKEDKKDVAIDEGCDGINCDKRSVAEQKEGEKEGTEFDQLFRQANPDIEVFEVVEEWRRDFTTFTQVTVLVRSGNLYWYLYLIKNKETSQLQFWGQQILEKPPRDQIGKFDLKNKQTNVPQGQVQSPLQQILNSDPQISDYEIRKALLRTFPENRQRVSIELRQPTQLVQYIVLNNGTSSWVQEKTILETGLPLLTKEIKNEVELQFKTEVIVDETLSEMPIEVSLPTQKIEIIEKVEPVIEVKEKKEVIQKVEESPSKGHTQVVYNEITPQQKVVVQKLTTNIPQAYRQLQPIVFETQKFCDSQDFVLIYSYEQQLIVLAFRTSLLENSQVQFLGERRIPQIESEQLEQMIARATKPQIETDVEGALALVSEKYPEYSSHQPLETDIIQIGQSIRVTAIYKFSSSSQQSNSPILHRFLISQSQTEQSPSIIQECRLNQQKQKYFFDQKFDEKSPIQEEIKTNDPERLVEKIPITEQVIETVEEILKKEKPELKPVVEEIIVEEYEKNIEYIVDVQEESEGDKLKKDIVVIVDKETEKIELVSVGQAEKQPESVQSVEVEISVDPQTHQPVAEEKLEKLIEKIVDQVKEDPKIPINTPEIIEITKKPVGNIEQIKEIIKDKDTEEVVEVISIVNEQENIQQIVSVQPIIEGQETPEPEVISQDYETIIEEDPSVQEIIEKLIEKPEEKPVSIIKKDFDIGTEYVVEIEEQKDGETITKEAVAVEVKETKEVVVVEKPTEQIPKEEKPQEKVIEIPISETKDKPDSGSPVLDELLEKAIEESIPKSEDNQTPPLEIIEITEEKQINDVEKVVEHVKNTETGQEYEVVAIIDEQLKKQVVLDVKEVEPKAENEERLIELKPEIILQVIEESVKEIQEKEQPTAPCCSEAPQIIQKVVIKPVEVEEKIKETLTKKQQAKEKEIVFPIDEALQLVHSEYPQTAHTTLLTQQLKTFPNSVLYTLTLTSPTKKYTVLVKKTSENTTEVVIEDVNEIPEVQIEEQKEITELVEEIQEQDTKDYQLIDPNSIWQSKALQLLTTKKLKEFQREIQISEIQTDDLISQAVIYLRANWAIIKEAVVIRVLEDINTPMTKQYSIYFFANEQNPEKSTKYKVYEFVIEIKLENNESTYDVVSIREVLENGHEINVTLQQKKVEEKEETINIAYGYESVPLTSLKNNSTLEAIVAQVETRYSDLIKTQNIISIEVLQLKSGKLNIIIRYPHIYFIVFWDPLLERVLLLNSVSSFSSEKYKPVQNIETNPYYGQSVQYCIGVHDKEIGLSDYKIVHSGEIETNTEFIFYNEISSGSKKFRCVVGVNKELHETRQISWDEIVQISLEHYKFDEMTKLFIANYQKLTQNQLQNNKDFKYVYNYALKQNKILETAHLIGAASKPQNLGFAFKIFFMLSDSQVVALEIYIQSFNQKLQQLSFSYLDLQNGFASIATEGTEVSKIIEAISKKAQITLVDGQYLIHSVEGKDFLFGNLFRVLIQVNGVEFSGILYHDHTTQETNLIQWKLLAQGQGCKEYESDEIHCVIEGCQKGFYWEESDRKCYRQTVGCQKYKEAEKQLCEECSSGFQRVNNVCTQDCGPACVFIQTF